MKHTYTIPAATLALCLLALANEAPAEELTAAIRPFHDYVPQAGFASLRKRIAQTRWPDATAKPADLQPRVSCGRGLAACWLALTPDS
ncbi:MAG TPA: hypothetical protein VJ484_08725 [Lysobacter sp.]|nr:hypothetical protein [Lysobacter sp.]